MEPVCKTPPGGEAAVRCGEDADYLLPSITSAGEETFPWQRQSRRTDGQAGRGRHGHRAAGPMAGRLPPGTGRSGFRRMFSRFVALRIRPAGREIRQGPELPVCWLLAEWPAGESEPVQFWLSDLPADTPLTTLVRLAKLRWRIELSAYR